MDIDTDRIDVAVLALLWLTADRDGRTYQIFTR